MSRFRKFTEPGDDPVTEEQQQSAGSPFTRHVDPRDEPPIDAEIVDEDPFPPPPLPTGQPLLVTVTQLQGTISELQEGVRRQLADIAGRLDALDQQAARSAAQSAAAAQAAQALQTSQAAQAAQTEQLARAAESAVAAANASVASAAATEPAGEPAWVRRLESTIEGLGNSAAASTAMAITTMGEQQQADLARMHARLDEVRTAASGSPGTAELASAIAGLCDDLSAFTDEIRRGFADLSEGLAQAQARSGGNDAVIAHLVDIRAALRLLVG